MNADLADVSPFAAFLSSFLDTSLPGWVFIFFAAIFYWFFMLIPAATLIGYMDRKIGADIQRRIGPNRVGALGIFQFLADSIKGFFKEDVSLSAAKKLLFYWGPVFAIICVFCGIASLPMAQDVALSNAESGLLCILIALIGTNLFLFWAGFGSGTDTSLLSAFRILATVAATIVPTILALIPPVIIAGSANMRVIVEKQGGLPWQWFLFESPGTVLSFVVLFWSLLIWQGHAPFDLARAPAALASGLLAEYSGVRKRFLMFLEQVSLFLSCAFLVSVYLGGWVTPFNLEFFGRAANLVEFLFFSTKVLILVWFTIWIRWSFPRLRADQLIDFSWKILVPTGILGCLITAIWPAGT